jgi:uncharacterized protein (DUF2236 family)
MAPILSPTTPLRAIKNHFRQTLLIMLSGDPAGDPEWVQAMSDGDDEGYFGKDSVVWQVNGGNPVMVAGVVALLMQTLHPGAMAGVHEHSRFRTDPLGRLAGTVRWVVTTTFASTSIVSKELERVAKMHQRVTGTYRPEGHTDEIAYQASDQDLTSWVHIVFTDAFLRAHRTWGEPLETIDGESGEDRYVRQWATVGKLMGMAHPPQSVAELHAQLRAFDTVIRVDERVKEAVRFILRPPLPRSVSPGYRILAAGAVAILDPHYRDLLGVRRPWWPAITATGILLTLIRGVLGTSNTQTRASARVDGLDESSR